MLNPFLAVDMIQPPAHLLLRYIRHLLSLPHTMGYSESVILPGLILCGRPAGLHPLPGLVDTPPGR
jgi:hypothetical protein